MLLISLGVSSLEKLLHKRSSFKMFLALFLYLPALALGNECCAEKKVGNDTYVYSGTDSVKTTAASCVDACVYVKQGTTEKFCFAKGELEVECVEGSGIDCKCGIKRKGSRIVGG